MDIEQGLDEYERKLLLEIENRLLLFIREVAADARANHEYQDRTGDLTKSIEGDITIVSREILKAALTARRVYADYIEHESGGKFAYLRPALERKRDRFRELFGCDFVIEDRSLSAGTGKRPPH